MLGFKLNEIISVLSFFYERKIIVKLKGGLGNQMFQYAVARGIQGGEKGVIVDDKFIKDYRIHTDKFTPRDIELHVFKNLKLQFSNAFQARVLYDQSIPFKILRKLFYFTVKVIQQQEHEFFPSLVQEIGPLYLDGFFQNEKYFKHIRSELLQEFSFSGLDPINLASLHKIRLYQDPVSLHVRRGDYLKPKVSEYHGILPLAYYEKSIRMIEDEISDPHYFIFSDDPEWCKEHFNAINRNYTIISHNDSTCAWKDMYLMTQCKHHIIANSSFSWWGAWLSTFEGGITLSPYKWFNPDVVKFNIHDFVPASWKIVTYE